MPAIISSTKLRNEYNVVSKMCHMVPEPVFVTKNGAGDLAVMSMEAYEMLTCRQELVEKLDIGKADRLSDRTMPLDEAVSRLRKEF